MLSREWFEKLAAACWKLKGVTCVFKGGRALINAQLNRRGYDAIISTDEQAEAFNDGLRVAALANRRG